MSFERCDDGHRCYNGAVCVENPEDEGAFFCDCDAATEDGAFSGVSCEHEATIYCNDENAVSRISFCTNGGTCTEQVSNAEAHFGCDCPKNYKGAFCQYTIDQNIDNFFDGTVRPKDDNSNNDGSGGGGFVIALLVIVILGGIAAFGFFVLRKKLRRFDSWNFTGSSKDTNKDLARADASGLTLEADGSVLKEAVESGAGVGYSAGDSSGDDMVVNAVESGHSTGSFTIDDNDDDDKPTVNPDENTADAPAVVTPTAEESDDNAAPFPEVLSASDTPPAETTNEVKDKTTDAEAGSEVQSAATDVGADQGAKEDGSATTEPEIV